MPTPDPTVSEVGEHALLARLRARLSPPPAHVVIGIGDDAAVVEPPRGALEVVTTDTLVEGIHFERRFSEPADIGRKALAVNLSDLAAMGAQPRTVLLSLGLPATLPVGVFDGFLDGFLAAAADARVTLIGGNLTRSPAAWFIGVTAMGTARRRRVLMRGGGRPGDELYVTGRLGAARAGLAWLLQRDESHEPPTAEAAASEALQDAAGRYRRPEARVRAGVIAGRARAASACMDLSDGLADAVTQVAAACETGAEVDLADLPAHPAVAAMWPDEAAWQALLGGDDYELLFAVRPRRRRAFHAAMAQARRLEVTRIGRLTDTGGARVVRLPDGSTAPLPKGYEHFADR